MAAAGGDCGRGERGSCGCSAFAKASRGGFARVCGNCWSFERGACWRRSRNWDESHQLKDTLFRLELRRQAGTISDSEYAEQRSAAEKVLRDWCAGKT